MLRILPTRFTHRASICVALAALLVLGFAARVTAQCVGDCNTDGEVTVDELLVMVNIAQGTAALDDCEVGDANGDGEITIDDILVAVNSALSTCPITSIPTPTPTAIVATPTAATPPPTTGADICAAVTPAPTSAPPASCGNGLLDADETCDDGNNTEDDVTAGTDVDRCPYNCAIASCAGATMTVELDVNLCIPEGVELGGATLLLRYPDAAVGIPGSGASSLVEARLLNILDDPFVSITPNDLDYALRSAVFSVDLLPIPTGRIFTVQFDVCPEQTVPDRSAFRCLVKNASDINGSAVGGVTCTVTQP
jgi:hypothetical protein